VAALAAESRLLGSARRGGEGPAALADGTLLIVSGMGPAAAGEGARRLVAAGAEALVSWGMAGGLDPALAAGTLVLPGEVVSPEGRLYLTASDWRERLRGAVAAAQPVCSGRLLTRRAAIASPADKALAFRQTGAAAVDMESSAVAEVAASDRLPFIAVRAIVDTAADTLPSAALMAAAAGAGRVRMGQLLGSLARTPAELPVLIRLASRYRAASHALAAVARSGALAAVVTQRPARSALP
jgi:adenosylhomocysteine nucleosidase